MQIISKLIENRIIIWNIKDAQYLFSHGYYGKPIGIYKPKNNEITAPLILDLIEGYYLTLKNKIQIFKYRKKLTHKEILNTCREEYHDFDKKFLIYKDFRDKDYIVNPGIKFGCDFAVYKKGPGIDHAPYLVHVYNQRDSITASGIILTGRLATTVSKQFVLAIPNKKNSISYLVLNWWKA